MAAQASTGQGGSPQFPDWFAKALGIGGGLGAAAGGLAGYFNPGKNPADQAEKTIGQIPGQTKGYYDPYIQAGQGALGQLQDQYGQLTNDPNAKLAQFGQGYQQSPGYKYALEQAMAGTNNAAAAGGRLGTLGHQQLNAETQSGIASKDYEDYLNHIIGLYGQGLQGYGQLNQGGQQASGDYAQTVANALQQQADLQYKGQAAQNEAKGGFLGNIFSGLGTAAGTAFGGPLGAAAGGAFGKWLGGKIG